MALAYDFDIFEVIPDNGPSDPQLAGFLSDAGFSPARESATVALFRNPSTARALRRAPPVLRDYFLASGFGLNTYHSGAPPGRYPARDEAARLAVIGRLAENAPRFALPRPEDSAEGGTLFRLGAFLADLEQARPTGNASPPLRLQDHGTGPVARRSLLVLPLPETGPPSDDGPVPHRQRFWQNRFFRLGVFAAALGIGLLHLTRGPGNMALASL